MSKLRQKSFLITMFLSSLANTFYLIALPLLVYEKSNSIVDMGVVAILEAVSVVLLFPFIGLIIDKFSSRFILVSMELLQFLILGYFYYHITNSNDNFTVYIVAVLISISSQFGRVCMFKIIPEIYPNDLKKGNSNITLISTIADFGGPVLSVILIAYIGIERLILLDSLISLFVAVLYMYILVNLPKMSTEKSTERKKFFTELTAGIKYTTRNKLLLYILIISMFSALADNGLINLLIFILKNEYSFSNTNVSIIFGLSTFASIIGSYYIGKSKSPIKKLYFAGLLINNIGVLLLVIDSWKIIPIVLILTGFGGIIFYIIQNSMIQMIVPKEILGRVNSFFRMNLYIARPLSIFLITYIADNINYYSALLFSILMTIFCSIIAIVFYRIFPPLTAEKENFQ